MEKIKLPKGEWEYDPQKPLGKAGGFGQVFSGKSKDGDIVAVKKLKIEAIDAAHRELRVAYDLSNRQFEHVIPIYDSGEDANTGHYFLIMPQAEKSLQDDLEQGNTFEINDVVNILLQVINGLIEVTDIVHRDLKPGNILYHEERWKIADFGIARFYEESTSLRTLKDCLSPLYAAPEQWKFERASHSTDIYALGCIGVCLLNGAPPFTDNPREGHLHGALPPISCDNPKLKSLLSMMLRKLPESRPCISRVHTILTDISNEEGDTDSSAFSKLAQAGSVVADRALQKETEREMQMQKQLKRESLATEALSLLQENYDRLADKIIKSAPAAVRKGMIVELGISRLNLHLQTNPKTFGEGDFPNSKWDIVTGATISIIQFNPSYEWSSSLWYAKLPDASDYRWIEVSYFFNPISSKRSRCEPFALDDLHEADIAASNITGLYCIAFGPRAIDDENEDSFHDRWADLFSKAAVGQLTHPSSLPIRG
jgi:serine/threonine-protein kinase